MADQHDPPERTPQEHGKSQAFLITGAPTPYDAQHRARVRRYLTLMAFRVPALVAGGIVYSVTGSAWWAVGIVALSVPLPWIAVLIANDRPPRKRGEVPNYLHGSGDEVVAAQALTINTHTIDARSHSGDPAAADPPPPSS